MKQSSKLKYSKFNTESKTTLIMTSCRNRNKRFFYTNHIRDPNPIKSISIEESLVKTFT